MNLKFVTSKTGGLRIEDLYFFNWECIFSCVSSLEDFILFMQLNVGWTHSCGPQGLIVSMDMDFEFLK